MNGVLCCFQQYFTHIMVTNHTTFMSFLVSPIPGSEMSCPRTLPQKTQRIQCSSNPGPLDYESNTLRMSCAGLKERSLTGQSSVNLPSFYLPLTVRHCAHLPMVNHWATTLVYNQPCPNLVYFLLSSISTSPE